MWTKPKAWLKRQADILERMIWTGIQVVSAAGIVEWFNLDTQWVLPITVALAAIKGAIASHFGRGSAATLPASLEDVPGGQWNALLDGNSLGATRFSAVNKSLGRSLIGVPDSIDSLGDSALLSLIKASVATFSGFPIR